MALTEGSTMDAAFGDFTESDLAGCHMPAHAWSATGSAPCRECAPWGAVPFE
ncbi:hypothetical protein [Streptomyces sp. HUAS ZL42]|uniref:hypothetical protein n=1 Tax=Streptomyces sp. HUAS ZL42 TaxID=3231715 RepID=UPI00345E3615